MNKNDKKHVKSNIFPDEMPLDDQQQVMQRTHEENLITWQGQISNDAGSNKCSAIPSNIEEDYFAMTLSRLGFVFSTHANVFKDKLNSKKLFP